jgi:membrane associated rhomboid family serine protease
VAALAGAWLSLFPRAHVGIVLPLGLFLEWVRAPAALLIAVWALLQLLFTFVGPAFGAVAWWAHVTGFVLGLVAGLAWRAGLRRRGAGGE